MKQIIIALIFASSPAFAERIEDPSQLKNIVCNYNPEGTGRVVTSILIEPSRWSYGIATESGIANRRTLDEIHSDLTNGNRTRRFKFIFAEGEIVVDMIFGGKLGTGRLTSSAGKSIEFRRCIYYTGTIPQDAD